MTKLNLRQNLAYSLSELKKDIYSFFNFLKDNKFATILCWFFILLSYGIKLFWYSIGLDTDIAINDMPWTLKWWMSIDRSGLVFTKKIFNLIPLNPYVEIFLMFFAIFWALMVLCFLFSYISQKFNSKSKLEFIIPCVFITQPLMEDQFNFTLQAFEFSFALFLVFTAVFMVTRWVLDSKNVLHLILAFLLLVWSFWSYQAIVFLCFAIILAIFVLIYSSKLDLSHDENFLRKVALRYAIFFISVFFTYFVANKCIGLFFNLFKDDYLNNMFLWNKGDILICLMKILHYMLKFKTYWILVLLMVFYTCIILRKKRNNKILFCLAVLGLIISPFILSIYLGNGLLPRMQIVLSFVMAFIFYFLASNIKLKFIKSLIVAMSLMLAFNQSYTVSGLLYSRYMRYQSEVELAHKISERIANLNIENIEDVPIDFIGIMYPEPVHLKTFFECWSPSTGVAGSALSFMKTIGYNYKMPNEEDHKKAKEIAKTMKIWPSKEAVKYEDGIIVIKLSEEPQMQNVAQSANSKKDKVINKIKELLKL